MTSSIAKSFKDIFSINVLLFVTKITLLAVMITSILLWFFHGMIASFITSYLSWLPWEWLRSTGAAVGTIATAYMIFIMILSTLTSLMIEPLLIKLAKKHYPSSPVTGSPNITTSLVLSLKSGLLFLALFLLGFPIMFIPLVGAVWMLWLWSIVLKAPTIYDVSSLFITDKTEIKSKIKKSTLMAMIAAGFNYIPVVNIFAPVFAQILFLHHVLGKEESVEKKES